MTNFSNIEKVEAKQVAFLKKEQTKLLKKKRLFRALIVFTRVLKVLTALASIAAAILILILPPIGFTLAIIGVVLWIFISYLERIPNPQDLFEETVIYKALPKVLNELNNSYKILDKNNPVLLQDTRIIDQKLWDNATRAFAKPHLEGSKDDFQLEICQVEFYTKKVNYTKSSAGCLLQIILLPVTIINAFDTETQTVANAKNETYLYKDEEIMANVFFAQAHYKVPPMGELYIIPKIFYNHQLSTNPTLKSFLVDNSWINQHYNLYTSTQDLEHKIITPALIDFMQKFFNDTQQLFTMSFMDNVFNLSVPLKEELINTDLNHLIDEKNYFKNSIQYINRFEQIAAQMNNQIKTA